MESYRKEVQSKLLKAHARGLRIISKFGILTIIDFSISNFLAQISKRFYRSNSASYGLYEAFFCSKDIDRWSRYAHVVNEISEIKEKGLSILEVGSGGYGISDILKPVKNRERFFLLDIRKDAFKGLRTYRANPIVGDGSRLPFRDKVFDIVVSVDTAEHIPKPTRYDFYEELKRVCKRKIVITCPLQSSDGTFQGRRYDILFQYFRERNGAKEPNTAQHIAAGHPTIGEINRWLPSSAIYGYTNCDVWLKYMLFSRKPFIGLFSGLLYYLFWRKDDDKPPYWGASIVWNREIVASTRTTELASYRALTTVPNAD